MSFDKETLFRLLPAFDRIRDHDLVNPSAEGTEDGPLKALLGLIAEQIGALEENLDQLYDDQFIETCAEWVVPYIGELVGARGLVSFPDEPFSQRAQVANTIGYRRRKGTAAVLEQLARDVTGWNANVVEYFLLLATTQYLNHIRPENLSMASLRDWEKLEYVNTPFDRMARTADVRRIESRRGKYNIPNIGVFLWRLDAYSSIFSPAYKKDARRFKFDALGKDIALYNMPEPEPEITHLAEPINVPMPISRAVMSHYPDRYYGAEKSVLIYLNGVPVDATTDDPLLSPPASPSSRICICYLGDLGDGTGKWANMPDDKIAIDPVLGRIAFPASEPPPTNVHVDYYYGFSDKTGGGDYGRSQGFSADLDDIRKIKVPDDMARISDAIAALELTGGVVEITDNEYYFETPQINIAGGKKIELRAADAKRPVLVLANDFMIFGGAAAEVTINGLLISGSCLRLPPSSGSGLPNRLQALNVRHCTLAPGHSHAIEAVPAQPGQPRLIASMPGVSISLERCICGCLRIDEEATVQISNSIIDAGDEKHMAYMGVTTRFGAPLHVENSTLIGRVATRVMELASNTIFFATPKQSEADENPVEAQRLQEGCVRFSYVPPGSRLPRQHRCQPANIDDATRVRPQFTSLIYGNAAYCQLSRLCAIEITQGSDAESEMGAFHNLYQPQREANLRTRLNEYLRFGLEAGIFYGS